MSYAAALTATQFCSSICDTLRRPGMQSTSEVTVLLQAWGTGDHRVEDRLFALLLLQSTALLNEACLHLIDHRDRQWQSRRHFLAFATCARRDGRLLPSRPQQLELALSVDTLLHQFETSHPDWCSIIDMQLFAGFTGAEAADALDIPFRTVQRKFADARRWLFERMEPHHGKR
jgi:DNA-directed RNA polymerase specialized sigma24 family protein